MRKRKKIIGLQVHHSVFAHDAMRGAINAAAGMDSVLVRRPDDPVAAELHKRARALAGDISQYQRAAQKRLTEFSVDIIKEARDGNCPWPDEPAPWEFE